MSKHALNALLALALVACSTDPAADVMVSDQGRANTATSVPFIASSADVAAPTPEIGPAPAPETVAEIVDTGLVAVPPGSVEDLVDGEGDPLLEIEVRAGESLVLLAGWSGLSVEVIASDNGIRTGATLYPGQLLELNVDSETFAAMQDSRDNFEDVRLDRYLARRGTLVGVTTHTVGTGETAWQIGRDHGELPLWVLASFNRDRNLDRLRIGQELNLPMLGDTVAMDDEPLIEGESVAEVAPDSPGIVENTSGGDNSTNP